MAEPRNDEVIFSEAIYDRVGIAGAPSIAYGDGTLINDALRRWHGNTPRASSSLATNARMLHWPARR